MAKAKFPGKPSKTSQVTRLRLSSKCVNYSNDASRIIAEETAAGLQFFHDNFPTDDHVSCFALHFFDGLVMNYCAIVSQSFLFIFLRGFNFFFSFFL